MTMAPDWRPTPEGIEFTGWAGRPLPTFPVEPDPSGGVPSAIRLLEELWGRNLLGRSQDSALLAWSLVYGLDRHEHALLGLPGVDRRLRAGVKTHLWLSARDFRIWTEVTLDGPGPESVPAVRGTGLIFDLPGGRRLPPREVGELILLLDRPLAPSPDERSVVIAEVKRLAGESPRVSLDP